MSVHEVSAKTSKTTSARGTSDFTGFVVWLWLQAAFVSIDAVDGLQVGPWARGILLTLFLVNFQIHASPTPMARLGLPLFVGGFELLQVPAAALPLVLSFSSIWLLSALALRVSDYRLAALERVYPPLQRLAWWAYRLDHLQPSAEGKMWLRVAGTVEAVRRCCARLLNRERARHHARSLPAATASVS